MSNNVVLLADGKVVRYKGNGYTIIPKVWKFSGAVHEFALRFENNSEKNYIYVSNNDLYIADQNKSRSGFYSKDDFTIYRNSNNSNAYSILEKSKLQDSDLNFAMVGDLFEIEILEFNPPYTSFYTQYKYTFKIQTLFIIFSNPVYYPQVIDTDPNSPTYNVKADTSINLLNETSGQFYTKNFGERVQNIPENKEKLSELMTLICFRIDFIILDNILEKIAINNLDIIADPDNWPNLPQVDQFIGYLLRDWGYAQGYEPSLILEDTNPKAFESYLNGLRNLYKFFNLKDETKLFPQDSQGNPIDKNGNPITTDQDSQRRLAYIVEVLPPTSIALLPYEYKISYLKKLMEGSINEKDEGTVLAIMHSFAETVDQQERDNFMNFLLDSTNSKDTHFDVLFHKMDDKTLAYILPAISSFFDTEESSRGNFCLAIYRIWEKSRFNFYYIPIGSQPNADGMNPNAYFLNEGIGYYQTENVQTVFDFNGKTTNTWPSYEGNPGLGLEERTYEKFFANKQLEKEKINIEKKINYNYSYLNQDGNYIGSAGSKNREETYHFKLHIFQSISVIGYKANIDSEVSLPEEPYFPAFLFYYHQEFDRLRKNYAKLSFAIDIAVEASLFFLTGGTGTLRHLRHLKYVTQMGKAFRGELAAQEVVYIWNGLNNASETFSVTAAMCMSYMNYLSATAANTPERNLADKAGNVFMLLTFLGVGTSFVTKYKAVNAAKAAQQMNNYLLLPADVRQVIDKLAGNFIEVVTEFRTQKLVSRPNILAKFDNPLWTQEIREAFYTDFRTLSDTDLDRLNSAATSIDNWKALYDSNITDRSVVDFILNQPRTNAIIRYYDVPEIKELLQLLEDNTRWKFLDDFGTQPTEWLNFLKDNPGAINRWDNLDGAGKMFAKQKPDKWLYVLDRTYENYVKWSRMSNTEILSKYGQDGLDLVNEVETFALNYIPNISTTKLLKNDILISGMKDKVTGISSQFFHNFSGYDFNKGGAYDIFMNGALNNPDRIFPNLKSKIHDIIAFNKKNYNMSNTEYLKNTGNYPGAHGEIRALDDLAKKKFPNYMTNPPSEPVFDTWLRNDVLGYNRNIQHGAGQEYVIMHTCADCFHILDLITFINPLN